MPTNWDKFFEQKVDNKKHLILWPVGYKQVTWRQPSTRYEHVHRLYAAQSTIYNVQCTSYARHNFYIQSNFNDCALERIPTNQLNLRFFFLVNFVFTHRKAVASSVCLFQIHQVHWHMIISNLQFRYLKYLIHFLSIFLSPPHLSPSIWAFGCDFHSFPCWFWQNFKRCWNFLTNLTITKSQTNKPHWFFASVCWLID